jgi:hypothetical protein
VTPPLYHDILFIKLTLTLHRKSNLGSFWLNGRFIIEYTRKQSKSTTDSKQPSTTSRDTSKEEEEEEEEEEKKHVVL